MNKITKSTSSSFEILPNELLQLIFSHCSPQQRTGYERVTKLWAFLMGCANMPLDKLLWDPDKLDKKIFKITKQLPRHPQPLQIYLGLEQIEEGVREIKIIGINCNTKSNNYIARLSGERIPYLFSDQDFFVKNFTLHLEADKLGLKEKEFLYRKLEELNKYLKKHSPNTIKNNISIALHNAISPSTARQISNGETDPGN